MMMQAVVTEGTGKRAQLDFTTVVGKTGTSSSYRDAWFVGFTGALVTGVWVGYDDFRPMGTAGHRRQPAGPGLAQLHVGGAHQLPQHPADSGPAACIPTRWPSSSGCRAEAHRSGPGAGADRAGDAEEVEHHARPDPGCAEASRRDHAPRQRPAGRPPPARRRPCRRPRRPGCCAGRPGTPNR